MLRWRNLPIHERLKTPFLAATLITLNAALCWPLFGTEYLDAIGSVEGNFITFAKFLRDHAPHVAFVPFFDAGLPLENAYLPMVPALTAIGSALARTSPAHAFHFLAALAYCAGPLFLFFFARSWSGKVAPSYASALLWTLLSPSALFPSIHADLGTFFATRRLDTMVRYGEVPHNIALSLLPLALWMYSRYTMQPTSRRFAIAVIAAASVALCNAFGIVALSLSILFLVVSRDKLRLKDFLSAVAVAITAYLLVCRFLTPSLISLLRVNSQFSGGDFRITPKTLLLDAIFAAALACFWLLSRRLADRMSRFAVLFALCFTAIPVLGAWNLNLIAQPLRYQLEMEIALCLLLAFTLAPVAARWRRARLLALPIALLALWIFSRDLGYARRLIRPLDISQSAVFRQARWIADHLPGQRIMVAGPATFWFNLFADNPQLSGGHDFSAPNWMQLVAVYTIYSGQNAGAADADISTFWLKVFGCGAIAVSTERPSLTLANPQKFDGRLPLLWRDSGDSVYLVPQKSASLAHVIPKSAIVVRRPVHGLDLAPVRAYAAALDDPSIPPATLVWQNPDQARITATLSPGQIISVQINYDPGWRASIAGRPLAVHSDQLGLILLDPGVSGNLSIDLQFQGGPERSISLLLTATTALVLLTLLCWPRFQTTSHDPTSTPDQTGASPAASP